MPRFDFLCPDCGEILEDHYVPTSRVLTPLLCVNCAVPMERQAAAPSFVIKGYSAKNGYTSK